MNATIRLRVSLASVAVAAALFALPARTAAAAVDCGDCHASTDSLEPVTKGRQRASLVVTAETLKGSVHESNACSECHIMAASEDSNSHADGGPKPTLDCRSCHEDQDAAMRSKDLHGKRHIAGVKGAPWCADCHGGHAIYPSASPKSNLSRQRQPELCGKCHATETLNTDTGSIAKRLLIERYKSSVHWHAIEQGKAAATCTDCHGHHSILPSSEGDSRVARIQLLETCRKCHPAEVETYSVGSHGKTMLHGNLDVPNCITCHGDHDMTSLRVQAGGKRDFAATQICIWCHGNERMMARYALDTSPVDHYMRDFHGQSQRGSSGTSATCADCHDAHHSLPESHPESRMHLSNRGTTCGKCHGASSESFIMSFSHKAGARAGGADIAGIVAKIYIALIVLIIGGMLVHNSVIWSYYARIKKRWQTAKGTIVRMSRFERLWHWGLLVSFFGLVFTGFALSFSESAFKWLYLAGMTEEMRALAHRIFAVVLIIDLLALFVYQAVHPRGRRWFVWMLPRVRDVREALGTMRFYLHLQKERPRVGVFNYAEKAEYFALLWGMAIMGLTGLLLWFSKSLPPDAPNWLINVSKTIHFYEALLAALAIFVWHFFFVFFHPEEYPWAPTWLTGRLTEHEARERFDDEAIAAQTPPPPRPEEPPVPPPAKEWLQGAPAAPVDTATGKDPAEHK